jgi:hypothetical protein
MTAPSIRPVTAAEVARRHDEFAAFERAFVYPLGADRFHIDHGADYLAFFRSLGEPFPFVAEADGRLIGLLVAVRRRIAGRDVFYLCDLKVTPDARVAGVANAHLGPATPAFGISMNAEGGGNRMVRVAMRCPEAAPLRVAAIALFSLDVEAWQRVMPLLRDELGPLCLHDPRGTKDIVLASTGAPMPLLHVGHGPLRRGTVVEPRPGSVLMLCLPADDVVIARLRAEGVMPSATATVLLRHMDDFDVRSVLTSDI